MDPMDLEGLLVEVLDPVTAYQTPALADIHLRKIKRKWDRKVGTVALLPVRITNITGSRLANIRVETTLVSPPPEMGESGRLEPAPPAERLDSGEVLFATELEHGETKVEFVAKIVGRFDGALELRLRVSAELVPKAETDISHKLELVGF